MTAKNNGEDKKKSSVGVIINFGNENMWFSFNLESEQVSELEKQFDKAIDQVKSYINLKKTQKP